MTDLSGTYIPERNDIVFLDFEPTRGKEIGKYRPVLVLSSRGYHQKTGLLICCPISTSIRGMATEVAVHSLDSPSVVASNLVHTMDWKVRRLKKVGVAEAGVLQAVLLRLVPLIGADKLLQEVVDGG